MADRYETDAWLVGELWKRCREMEDQIAELKKDLSVAEEFSRKQTEIINEQETTISDLNDDLKEVKDHRDRLILESASAARPMPTYARPVPANGTSLPEAAAEYGPIATDHNSITTVSQPEPAKEPTPEARALVNGLEPQTADRKPDPGPNTQIITNGKRSIFSDQDVEDIKNRYLSGETSTSIAVDYNCAGSTINKLMSKHGVRKQTHERTVRWIDKGKVWALHDAGWSTEKICEEFVAADATPEKIEEILAKPRPGRPGRKKKVVEE